MISLRQSHVLYNTLITNSINIQINYVKILYNMNIMKTSIEQMTIISRKINLKISVLYIIKLVIKYKLIYIKFK